MKVPWAGILVGAAMMAVFGTLGFNFYPVVAHHVENYFKTPAPVAAPVLTWITIPQNRTEYIGIAARFVLNPTLSAKCLTDSLKTCVLYDEYGREWKRCYDVSCSNPSECSISIHMDRFDDYVRACGAIGALCCVIGFLIVTIFAMINGVRSIRFEFFLDKIQKSKKIETHQIGMLLFTWYGDRSFLEIENLCTRTVVCKGYAKPSKKFIPCFRTCTTFTQDYWFVFHFERFFESAIANTFYSWINLGCFAFSNAKPSDKNTPIAYLRSREWLCGTQIALYDAPLEVIAEPDVASKSG